MTGISYGSGQGHPVVRLRQPAPADPRHAEDLRRRHRRVRRLRVQRRRRDHLRRPPPAWPGPASSTYTYDEAGRLTSWNNGTTTTSYGYDGNGNLTQAGAKTYTYDARDELTGDGTSSYAYTARGTPSSESGPSGTVAVDVRRLRRPGDRRAPGRYAYDALGRLTADTPASAAPATQFSYAGATGTIASDGTSTYTWDPSGSVLAGVGAAGRRDAGGSLALTDAHGDVVGQFTAVGHRGVRVAGLRPVGQRRPRRPGRRRGCWATSRRGRDPASGKDLMGARWYDPSAGDFTSADTVQVSPDPDPAAGNPFAYAGRRAAGRDRPVRARLRVD